MSDKNRLFFTEENAFIGRIKEPEEFTFNFPGNGQIVLHENGSVSCNIKDMDDAASKFVMFVESHFRSHIELAEARVRAEIARDIKKACETVMGIETPMMGGDNLAIMICTHFEDIEGETDDNGWHPKAIEGHDQVKLKIEQHFLQAIDAARDVKHD